MNGSAANQVLWDDQRLANPHEQADKAARVRAMFDEIAPTYERVNRVLSGGRDSFWRRRAVQLAAITPQDRVLDLACGTGDFARAFADAGPAEVVGCDFSEKMLGLAASRSQANIRWCRADALRLPLPDASFSVTSCAFGVRNFQSLAVGLREMHRVLRPGGRAVILEFSMPHSPLLGRAYLFYFRRILPRIATWISHDRSGAYRYLPSSVSSFVDERGMREAMSQAGFVRMSAVPLTLGIVTIHVGWKDV